MELLRNVMQIVGPILIAALTALLIWRGRRKPVDLADEIEAWMCVKETLRGPLLAIVTDLERMLGDKTGEIKLAAAKERLLHLIPDQWRATVTDQAITNLIEDALAEAKLSWGKNPGLLGGGITIPKEILEKFDR